MGLISMGLISIGRTPITGATVVIGVCGVVSAGVLAAVIEGEGLAVTGLTLFPGEDELPVVRNRTVIRTLQY